MNMFVAKLSDLYSQSFAQLKRLDFIVPLLLRLYLAPIFIVAGLTKLQFGADVGFFAQFAPDPNIVAWFGNPDWGLGLPMPSVLAFLAAWSEFLGGWLLLFGLGTRIISIPLAFTMLIAATTAHWDNGWFAIAPSDPDTSSARVLAWAGIPGAQESLENSEAVGSRLSKMRSILRENGNTDWLFEKGSIVVLNNGIEFAATYFIMCLALLFYGAGRFVSVDYWLRMNSRRKTPAGVPQVVAA
ncbi:HvfX family Cu-binding RiPP maturation protein [Aurantivibrio plasticivorans]